jgi:hypothetical protein
MTAVPMVEDEPRSTYVLQCVLKNIHSYIVQSFLVLTNRLVPRQVGEPGYDRFLVPAALGNLVDAGMGTTIGGFQWSHA